MLIEHRLLDEVAVARLLGRKSVKELRREFPS
jgi:hypothetical protein